MAHPAHILLSALLLTATLAAAPPSTRDEAPADVYFGPFKYSAIAIRTKIDALGRAYVQRWADDASLLHDALLVQAGYDDWARRYPKDRWLAPTAFHLAQLYFEIQTDAARSLAKKTFEYVAKTFPNTKEGRLSRLRLRQGFPPLHAESPVSPTPNPYGSPSASPESSASPSAAPTSASPANSAVPQPRPT